MRGRDGLRRRGYPPTMFAASPTLRIAGYSWRAGKDDGGDGIGIAGIGSGSGRRRGGRGAVIAQVTNGAIRVSPYLQGHIINHGGIPQ